MWSYPWSPQPGRVATLVEDQEVSVLVLEALFELVMCIDSFQMCHIICSDIKKKLLGLSLILEDKGHLGSFFMSPM